MEDCSATGMCRSRTRITWDPRIHPSSLTWVAQSCRSPTQHKLMRLILQGETVGGTYLLQSRSRKSLLPLCLFLEWASYSVGAAWEAQESHAGKPQHTRRQKCSLNSPKSTGEKQGTSQTVTREQQSKSQLSVQLGRHRAPLREQGKKSISSSVVKCFEESWHNQ